MQKPMLLRRFKNIETLRRLIGKEKYFGLRSLTGSSAVRTT
jgi:hypothetical protein